MDEYDADDDEQGSESPEEPVASTPDAVAKKLAKLEKDNYNLRGKVRRADLTAKFGSEIAELVPDALPHDKWDEYAEKLQGLRGPVVDAETKAEAPPVEEPTATEQALAAVSSSPSATSAGSDVYGDMTSKQIQDLLQKDYAAGRKAMAAKYADSINP